MATGSTLFLLRGDGRTAFDGSTKGIALTLAPGVAPLPGGAGFRLTKGSIDLARHPSLDGLQAFTIEATVNADAIGAARQNIVEGQTPGISLFIAPGGKLVCSVNTAQGWVGVDSGAALIKAKTETRVAAVRDATGKVELRINDAVVGSKAIPGPVVNAGAGGLRIGTWVDGAGYPFAGTIASLQIREGALAPQVLAQKTEAARRIEQTFKTKTGLTRVAVNLLTDYGNSRLQPIKDIMNAAGVQKLSDLDTLQIKVRTVMTPGRVLIAPRKSLAPKIDWSKVARDFRAANAVGKRDLLARSLANRNSAATLKAMPVAGAAAPVAAAAPTLTVNPAVLTAQPLASGGRISALSAATATTGPRVPAEVLSASPTLRLMAQPIRTEALFVQDGASLKLADQAVIANLESANPALWANVSAPAPVFYSLHTIPVNSAVLIGSTIDLTETELVVEPGVATLYLIADRLICGNNAKITWRRPGGSTPARQDNPDLNGRGWSGIHTKPNSDDGLDGLDGSGGEPGIGGAAGLNAPNLEIWVKDMSGMPNLDLNGEDGRAGGVGQRGGAGGDGADGAMGTKACFFACWCWSEGGDGGDGGDGGKGGRGGRGGNGGNGGNISIAVLENTLESTVTNRAFKIKNQGGQRGRGGAGGAGGRGGRAGRGGRGEYCTEAKDGHAGAQGQPGAVGGDGTSLGTDGEVRFYEFSQDEWDALLTRPWVSEVSPVQVPPGERVTLRGSRFSSSDRVILAGASLAPTINPDESISVTVPLATAGGQTTVYVRRQDGTESNRYNLWIKPQLDAFSGALNPGATVTLTGRAFVAGASVLVDGAANPATVVNATRLTFAMPGTGGAGGGGNTVSLQVRNPDGLVSNSRSASVPRILEIPFRYGTHNLPFDNFTDGIPDWGTYEDTYGTVEVWHELLDPVFGHPILTAAFYAFYEHFLKGEANGGLATGFCTSLASLVADNFWAGRTDTHTLTKASLHRQLTAIHGKLLSRESLIHFHDQGRAGVARVEQTAREIEATFLRGCDRNNAPLVFFIPAGAAWDAGYFDRLSDSHCVMPYRFVYPVGHPGPLLAPGGATTLTDLNGVEMYVWDCNNPESPDCKICFRTVGGRLEFDFFSNSSTAQFSSQDGITLGMMTNGDYLLADHDLPFSGPLGLTSFVLDFLLSPADMQITDANGLRVGNFGGQIVAEMPDSHPCYLVPGAYLLPTGTALTRRIVGNGSGKYSFHSIMPDGGSLAIQDVTTVAGQVDLVSMSADGTQLRIAPGANKTFKLTLARQVGDQARAIAIDGIGGAPGAEIDIALSPELSLARIGNRGAARNLEVRAFTLDRKTNAPLNKRFAGVDLPSGHDLMVTVADWATLDANVQTLSFQP